jgi:hypothetical protein
MGDTAGSISSIHACTMYCQYATVVNLTALEGACKQVKQIKLSLPASLNVQPNAGSLRHSVPNTAAQCFELH